MSELVSYMFISLDGYIADAGGGLEWTPIDDELMAVRQRGLLRRRRHRVRPQRLRRLRLVLGAPAERRVARGHRVRRDLQGSRPDRGVEHAR